ncbi:hypothetical protein CDV31_000623 [Fusarium ambrosium]|uniref:Uncharacterized protein n=1 Tax=Fusarium ambrosium TaxID=131363 RepID=A0A428V1H5_9HYPO|nr:hypothetical protein CDV31_000623 [Fusarium ambrosium]
MSLGDEGPLLSNTPTTLLTVGDLPIGPIRDADIASATRLCKMFNDHRRYLPEHVANEILRRLKKGLFHHNSDSVSKPSRHRIVAAMRDDKFDGPVWHNATYENWFLVAGVYEGRLKNAPLSYIARVVSSRYGWDLSKDLRYKHGPTEQSRPRLSSMVTQMAATLVELQERIHELEGGRDRRSRSRIRDAIHTVTQKAKGALKRTASSLTDKESLQPQDGETSVDPSNEEEGVSQDDTSFLDNVTEWV